MVWGVYVEERALLHVGAFPIERKRSIDWHKSPRRAVTQGD